MKNTILRKANENLMYVIVISLILMSGVEVSASTISFETDPAISGDISPDSGTLSLSQFDPSWGTLEIVKLELFGESWGGYYEIDNEGGAGTLNSISIGSEMGLSNDTLGADLVSTIPEKESLDIDIAADSDAAPDFAGSDWYRITGPDSSNKSTDDDSQIWASFMSSPFDDVSDFIGVGNMVFDWNSETYTSSSQNFTPFQAQADTANYSFIGKVTYTYTGPGPSPIPEPATMLLFGGGLLGLAGISRRKFSAKK